MTFANYIWLAIIICGVLYVLATSMVFWYELRLRRLYVKKQQIIAEIELLNLSMAVKHAKQFKVEEDYRLVLNNIESKKLFLMKKMLHISRCDYGCRG